MADRDSTRERGWPYFLKPWWVCVWGGALLAFLSIQWLFFHVSKSGGAGQTLMLFVGLASATGSFVGAHLWLLTALIVWLSGKAASTGSDRARAAALFIPLFLLDVTWLGVNLMHR